MLAERGKVLGGLRMRDKTAGSATKIVRHNNWNSLGWG